MPTNMKRYTVVLTPEIEKQLDALKQKAFYNKSQSEMTRQLIDAGLRAYKAEKAAKEGTEANA